MYLQIRKYPRIQPLLLLIYIQTHTHIYTHDIKVIFIFHSFLQTEDTQKLQLIPLKKPLITSEHLQQKLVQPENNNSSTLSQPPPPERKISSVTDCTRIQAINRSNNNNNNDSIATTTVVVVATNNNKQLNKKQKEKNNNKQKPLNLKKQQTTTTTTSSTATATKNAELHNIENAKISKHLTNVKFAFEINENHVNKIDNEILGNNVDAENNQKVGSLDFPLNNDDKTTNVSHKQLTPIQENPPNDIGDDVTTTGNEDGNYDELPLIRIEEFGEDLVDNVPNSVGDLKTIPHSHFTQSQESIPFIDESPNRKKPSNYHDARFITINPQNIGSNQLENTERIHLIDVPKRERFDKSAQILYQSQMELPIAHHFQVVDRLDVKLCQVCHEFMVPPSCVRCLTCGFVCHENCVATKVSANR